MRDNFNPTRMVLCNVIALYEFFFLFYYLNFWRQLSRRASDWRINFFVPLVRRGDPELEGEKSSLENLLLKSLADHPDLKVFIFCYDSTFLVPNFEEKIATYLKQHSPLKEAYGKRLFFIYDRPGVKWSPHQKLVVLDTENTLQAFVGGVDLCDGRWDWYEHTLVSDMTSNLGPGLPTGFSKDHPDRDLFFLEKNFTPGTSLATTKDKNFYGQSHDFHTPLHGGKLRHTLHVLYLKHPKDFDAAREILGINFDIRRLSAGVLLEKLQKARKLMQEQPDWCAEHATKTKEELRAMLQEEWKRLSHYYTRDSLKIEELLAHKLALVPFFPMATEENIELLTKAPHPCLYPRMPWHDVACAFVGPAAWDVAENFVQRWEKTARKSIIIIEEVTNRQKLEDVFDMPDSCRKPGLHRGVPIPKDTVFPENQNRQRRPDYPARIQVVRSIDKESLPSEQKEQGIWLAYRQAIRNAIHYIYIESQFFGTKENKLHQDLADRVKSAIDCGETFRVYLILPVFPEEGWTGQGDAISLANQQAALIKAGGLLHQVGEHLLKKDPTAGRSLYDAANWSAIQRYIGVFSLRSYAEKKIFGHAFEMTERIYVHSKFMLVDDRVMIIGSANINDRSLAGDRDNEIAAVIMGDGLEMDGDATQGNMNSGAMDGKVYYARNAALQLRRELWLEHFGAPNPQLDLNLQPEDLLPIINDPVAESTWQFWHHLAARNTAFYAKKFRGLPAPCRPSDLARDSSIYDQYMTLARRDGFAIRYPGEPDPMTRDQDTSLRNPNFKNFHEVEKKDQDVEILYPKFDEKVLAKYEGPALRPQLVYYPLDWMGSTKYFKRKISAWSNVGD